LDVLPLWLVLYVVALPLVMACSILIRDSMKFFRYFLLSNLVQKVILEKSLKILIVRPYIFASFTKFYQNCFSGLGVKAFFSIVLT
jgi:hypothetical protein